MNSQKEREKRMDERVQQTEERIRKSEEREEKLQHIFRHVLHVLEKIIAIITLNFDCTTCTERRILSIHLPLVGILLFGDDINNFSVHGGSL